MRSSFACAVLAFGFVLVACAGAPDDDVTGSTQATVSTGADGAGICAEVQHALVQRRYRCAFGPGVAPVPSEGPNVECDAFARAVEAGRVSLDGTAVAACIDDIDRSDCVADNSSTFDPNGPCARLIVHDLAGPCTTTLECGGGTYCSGDVYCPGQCNPRGELSEACSLGGVACAYGLACAVGPDSPYPMCEAMRSIPLTPITPLGQPCGDSRPQCEPIARCSDGRCIPRASVGEPCAGLSDCTTSRCSNGVCRLRADEGEACATRLDCRHGLACSGGVCITLCAE